MQITIPSFFWLPSDITVHYNIWGEGNGTGDKNILFTLPIIGTVVFFAISIAMRIPQKFNYAVKLTEEKAEKEYTHAVRTLGYIRTGVALTFFLIAIKTLGYLERYLLNSWLSISIALIVVAIAGLSVLRKE